MEHGILRDTALAALLKARDEQALVVAREQAKLNQLEEALNALQSTVTISGVQVRQDFKHMGITEAAARLLEEASRPLSTREIADQIRLRGVTTKSKNYIPTVYATLANSPLFAREGANWTLTRRGRTEQSEQHPISLNSFPAAFKVQ